jgi:hypothetical protein
MFGPRCGFVAATGISYGGSYRLTPQPQSLNAFETGAGGGGRGECRQT